MLFNITFLSYTAKPAVEIEAETLLAALYKYLKRPRANLRGANLRGADLYGANLRRADLYGADLYGANLYGANLREADLRGADLYGANLREADLRGADLYGANLRRANLRGADLRGADLRGATDMKYLKSLNFDTWQIGYTAKELQIGCQCHDISKWQKWNTASGRKWIASMDDGALAWADKYLALVLRIVELAPAKGND